MAEFTPKTPIAGQREELEAIERSLEQEAPNNDRRDRYSKEYSALANNSVESSNPETDMVPDGQDTYPEEESFLRARGENIEGSRVVEGEDEQAPMVETPDSEGYASDWKGQHPSPDEVEDEETRTDQSQRRSIPPTNPDLPSGR